MPSDLSEMPEIRSFLARCENTMDCSKLERAGIDLREPARACEGERGEKERFHGALDEGKR